MCSTRNFTLNVAGFNYSWVCGGVMIVVAQITCLVLHCIFHVNSYLFRIQVEEI